MIKIRGLLIKAESENIYSVTDQDRQIGYITKIYINDNSSSSTKKMFRTFGQNFEKISDAIYEFLKRKYCHPFEIPNFEETERK